MQKRYREAQERMPYRPDSAVKTTFELVDNIVQIGLIQIIRFCSDFEIYTYSPSMSQLSLNTPSVSAVSFDYTKTFDSIFLNILFYKSRFILKKLNQSDFMHVSGYTTVMNLFPFSLNRICNDRHCLYCELVGINTCHKFQCRKPFKRPYQRH